MDYQIKALAVFDDGGGPALYAGGMFDTAGGVPASGIAKWDGATWSPLGEGMNAGVLALAVADDGGGPALFAGGGFTLAGGMPANRIAKWDGASWSALGQGMDQGVLALTVADDGGGPALFAGGTFTSAGGAPANLVAKWDGGAWSALGSGVPPGFGAMIMAMSGFDGGTGPALYVGGLFTSAGGVAAANIARWDGSNWSPLGGGVNLPAGAFARFDDGAGEALYVGGGFTSALDSHDSYLAKWGCAAIAPAPGCYGNPATLSALSPAPIVGQPFSLELGTASAVQGIALLVLGADGTDAAGCGLFAPGLGEVLVALSPPPLPIAQQAIVGGIARFDLTVPADPTLVGITLLLQAGAVDLSAVPSIELSNGLHATVAE
jgi:trimeric autotransporter adhesin